MPDLERIEKLLFRRHAADVDLDSLPILFIVASPRTGSTLIYQYLINRFGAWYVSNFVDAQFSTVPAVGVALELSLTPRVHVGYESSYGKTEGLFAPSEGSHLFRNWFGGEHPSQTCSSKVLPGMQEHFISTMKCIHRLTGRALLMKNAWNCFRIEELARILPSSHFVWIRRDIRASAVSDLEARHRRGGPNVWNSATTTNYKEIQKRPYWEQVVEQQYEYNKAVGKDLREFREGHYIEMWYEGLCSNPESVASKVEAYFAALGLPIEARSKRIPVFEASPGPEGMSEDREMIAEYVSAEGDRLSEYTYNGRACAAGGE